MKCYIILLALFISMPSSAKNNHQFYNDYFLYKEALKLSNYTLLATYLTNDNREYLMANGSLEDFDKVFPVLSSFPFILEKESSNYQLIDDNKGCFTVNGFDSDSDPVSINIEYKKENNSWRLEHVHIAYHSSADDFIESATCPLKPN